MNSVMQLNSTFDKTLVGLIVVWLIASPFLAILLSAPPLFVIGAPFILLFGGIAVTHLLSWIITKVRSISF